ncbi:MAG TPA: hypothetical protein DET40_17160 [Lentisphaeria bacterium]|nr:MAG: hypothetical protein A2X45_02845 [Lentisphaerae bacterium GWF2_50_93]HCE45271.1 hypothetical protein [Lentisphaeria bacterium]
MKLKIHIGIPAILVFVSIFINPLLLGAKPDFKPFIAPTKSSPLDTEDVPSLIKALGSKEDKVRSHAVETLSKIGEPSVPSLIEALTDVNSSARKGAVDALGNIGNIRPEILPALIKLLMDRDSYVRKSTVESLDKIGEPAVPFIIKALSDKDSYIRKGAADALGRIRISTPEIVPSLINALTDSDSNVRKSAVESLEKRGSMTAELKARRYIRDLGDSNCSGDIRISAIEALDKIGPIIPEVMPAVISALGDSDYIVRKDSAEFLEKAGSLTVSLKAQRYIFDLKYGKSVVRIKAVEALGKIGSVTPEVVPSIINEMGDREICDTAIKALGNIGSEAKSAVPALAKALTDSDSSIRAEAAKSLGRIGPAAKSAAPSLMEALKDADPAVRAKTAEALKKLGVMTAKDNVSYLTFSHPILAVFTGICVCLLLFFAGWLAVPVVWRLLFPLNWYIRELHNPQDEKRRVLAGEALARIGNSSIPFLIKMLENKNNDIRISAAEALNEFRSVPPDAITLILKSMRDKEEEVRRNIVEVFGKTLPATPEVFTALVKALDDGNSGVRASAAEVLGRNGASREAVPALKKAIEDSSCQVRENAFNALEKYGAMTVEIRVKRYIADLGDSQIDISERAKEELSNIGTVAIPELIKKLGDGNSNVRRFAASLLEKYEALTVDIKVKRYILDLGDSQTSVLAKAAKALGDIGPEASESVPHLVKLIGNKDYYVRLYAAQALEKIGALSQELKEKRHNLDLADSNGEAKNKDTESPRNISPEENEALPT